MEIDTKDLIKNYTDVYVIGDTNPVGKPVVREDAVVKVTGKAVYAADIYKPGMLFAKVLLSSQAHAIIKNIDTSDALRLKGVHAVITAKDIPGENIYGIAINDQPALADGKVRFIGEPVAAVAAEDPFIAEEASRRIRVDYQPLPAVFDPLEALKPGAPEVHLKGNILLHTKVRKGDIQRGFDEADVVIENIYKTHGQDHAPLEPESGTAWFETDGILVINSATQYVFRDRKQIARVLNLPINKIRCINCTMGGGFGRKDDITVEIILGLLVQATHRPVRLIYSRHESMLTQTHRHPTITRVRTGVTREGKLTAMEGVTYGDTGAYSSLGIYVIKKIALHLGGPYFYPNYKADSISVYTNNPISGPFRGFGVFQAAIVHESQMDQLADKVGMDPLEFRINNCLRSGLTTSTGQVMNEGCGIKATLESLKEYADKHQIFFSNPERREP